jgi:hypothetical protein
MANKPFQLSPNPLEKEVIHRDKPFYKTCKLALTNLNEN